MTGVQTCALPISFVPIRYLAYGLGVAEEGISWEGQTSTATLKKGETEVELAIGSQEIIINGSAKAMDVAPILHEGRTFLPARFVAEALGYQVDWIGARSIVSVYGIGNEQPVIPKVLDYLDGKEQTLEPIPVSDYTIGEVFIEGEILAVDLTNYTLELEIHLGTNTPADLDPTITIERNALVRQLEGTKETGLSIYDLKQGMIVGIILNPDGKARAIINHVF